MTGRRVGELATATGLTVRTLHYYDEIGLLEPSGRTSAGHRLYSDADVERLYRICFLRRVGLSLDNVTRFLDDTEWSLGDAMTRHLADVDERLAVTEQLGRTLAQLLDRIRADDRLEIHDLLILVEEMNMIDNAVQRRIVNLVYEDLDGACADLSRVFGLTPGQVTRDGAGTAIHAEVHAGDGVLWLHKESPQFRLQSPKTLGAATASVAVMVDDVDAHYRRARQEGAEIEYEPVDQPYGYREYSARDFEGGLWSFMKPLD